MIRSPGSHPARVTASARLASVALFLVAIVVTMYPGPRVADLMVDGSWAQVVAHGLLDGRQFGTELVFTYGPLGLLTPVLGYVPDAFATRFLLQIVFAMCFATMAVVATINERPLKIIGIALAMLLVAAELPGDVAWFTTYLLAAACLRRIGERYTTWRLALGLAALSLLPATLPLVKVSLLPAWVAWLCLGMFWLARRRGARYAALFAAINIAILLMTWMACGQALGHIVDYVASGMHASASYGSAMGIPPPANAPAWLEAAMFLTLLGAIACAVSGAAPLPGFVAAVLLVLAWKLSVVRADFPHLATFPALCCVVVPWLQGRASRAWRFLWVTTLAAAVGLLFTCVIDPPGRSVDTLASTLRYVTAPMAWRADAERELAAYQRTTHLPSIDAAVGDDTVDIMGQAQGLAYTNGLHLQPRPAIQSYFAFTPQLAALNEAFFLDATRAPQWVLMDIQGIDNRLAFQGDGAAMLAVLRRYQAIATEHDLILMKRRPEGTVAWCPAVTPVPDVHILGAGETVAVAPSAGIVRATLVTSLTWKGRLRSLVSRPPIANLVVTTSDHKVHAFRVVPAIAASGFVLSPALVTNEDLMGWLAGDRSRSVTAVAWQPMEGSEGDFSARARLSLELDPCPPGSL